MSMTHQTTHPVALVCPKERWWPLSLAVLFFCYVLFVRVHGISVSVVLAKSRKSDVQDGFKLSVMLARVFLLQVCGCSMPYSSLSILISWIDLDEKRPPMNSAFTSPNHSRATSPTPDQDWSHSFTHLHDEKRTHAPSRRPSLGPPEQKPFPTIANSLTPRPSTSREHSPARDASSSLHDHSRRPKPKPKLVLAYRPPPSGDDPFTPVETPAPVIRAFIRNNPAAQASNPAPGHAHDIDIPPLPRLPQVPLLEKALVQERRPLPVPRPSFS